MKIKVDNKKCTGCLLCEVSCSIANLGYVDRNGSAIRVNINDLSIDFHEPILCKQCKKMNCLKSEGKDFDEEERKKFFWENPQRVGDCPFNAIFEYNDRVVHCWLCGGDPECVKSCPTGALTFE
jgi:Fe-S-cluster-containing hydrogenase component 2